MKENLAATLPMTCLDDITRLAGLEELVGRSDLVRLDKSCNLIDYPDLSDQLTLTLTFTHSRIHSLLPSIQLAVPIKNENPAQLKRTHAHTRADTHTLCLILTPVCTATVAGTTRTSNSCSLNLFDLIWLFGPNQLDAIIWRRPIIVPTPLDTRLAANTAQLITRRKQTKKKTDRGNRPAFVYAPAPAERSLSL